MIIFVLSLPIPECITMKSQLQDFITSAYCFTHKDTFLTKSEFYRIAAALVDSNAKVQTRLRIPPSAIFKPVELWTGKQVVCYS